MQAKLIFVHALSPLHAGSGQGVGVIDLPIAREKATGIPYLPGSSLKGTLRDLCTEDICQREKKEAVFGPETANASDYAGSAQFSDQRLLLLPIRSLFGTFAWVTSPFLLQRFKREAAETALTTQPPAEHPQPGSEQACVAEAVSAIKSGEGAQAKVILEDLDLAAAPSAAVTQWGNWLGQQIFPGAAGEEWRKLLTARLCVVPDDVLNFLLDTATEVTARIKLLDDKKTVQKGGLWYEEALPAETILSGLLVATEIKQNGQPRVTNADIFRIVGGTIVNNQRPRPVQLGGKASTGKGLCYVHLAT
ncbi:MAG: type III-B CRISPR module RAMP protein Cmr4 [Acidobacteria bacterium]|nr:type III-B CRISPR module RAMP protein Cmr4 [Acidobacteriota bacterium]